MADFPSVPDINPPAPRPKVTPANKRFLGSRLVNRNISTTAGRTSIRLEPEFWAALDGICRLEETDRNEMVQRIEAMHPGTKRTSAVRVFILNYLVELGINPIRQTLGH